MGRRALALGVVALGALGACSAPAVLPPEPTDCNANDAGCSPAKVSGGGGSGSEAGTTTSTACGTSASDSQCTQCAGNECCATYEACFANSDCDNLWNCAETCGGTSSCTSGCEAQFPTGTGAFGELASCLQAECTVCYEAGIGDPCVAGETTCDTGLECVNSWCTKACADAAECTGLGPSGGNAIGETNACIASTQGDLCFPGCTTDSDCSDFPETFCYATTSLDGLSVSICTHLPDAGI